MSYTLQKPYTQIQKADFIVLHNHQNGRKIEETPEALYALEADEIMQDGEPVKNPDYAQEQLAAAKEAKIQEASDKAFEYRNKTGLISFDGRPVALPLAEGETTLTVHTELLNQDDMFQRVVGFQQGKFTEDQIYNTKEDIPVYINAQEAQAIYFAIVARAQKLWVEDYMTYRSMIEACTTPEEVNASVIDYDSVPEIPENSEPETEVTDENPST